MASQCTSFLLHSKPIQQNYKHSSKHFKPKSVLYRLMRLRLLVKMLLMETILGVKVIMNIVKMKKPFWGYFCRLVSRALTLRPRNPYIYIF